MKILGFHFNVLQLLIRGICSLEGRSYKLKKNEVR